MYCLISSLKKYKIDKFNVKKTDNSQFKTLCHVMNRFLTLQTLRYILRLGSTEVKNVSELIIHIRFH